MAPHVARPAMRKPLIAGLSKPGNGSAHYLKGTEKGKPILFQCPIRKLLVLISFANSGCSRSSLGCSDSYASLTE